jgi:adenylate cyclase
MSGAAEPEWAMATILFADIRGFTSFADRTTAREAVGYLNEFFEVVVPIVKAAGGEVNQLLGDGLLAVFTAPDHADGALAASRRMLNEVDERLGERCRIGIGLNSGLVLIGTIAAGGLNRLSVIGDPVNVASRVQDATRDLGEALLLTEATRVLLDGDHPTLGPRGALNLKGKANPIAVYAPEPDPVTLLGRSERRK